MSTFGDAQVRKLYIANSATATVAASPHFLGEGEVQIFKADGDGVPTAKGPFFVATKADGKVLKSEIIDPDKKLDYSALKSFNITLPNWDVTFTGTIASTVGRTVVLSMPIDNYGANIGSANPYIFHASYVIQPGDTVDDIATGIVASGNDNADRTGVPIDFQVTGGPNVVHVQTNRTPYKLGKFAGEPLRARLYITSDAKDEVTSAIVEGSQLSTINGIEISNLEWFTLGNTGDIYRGMGYPNNFDTHYVADPGALYEVIDLAYYSERIPAPGDKQRAVITIAVNDTADPLGVAAQITDPLTAALGL